MRKLLILLVVLGLLAGSAYGGRKVYRKWKTAQAIAQAREALAKSDYNKAGLWLRRALSSDNRNAEAVRLMGDFAEGANLTEAAVFWRNRLVELEPSVATNRLMLARAAITARDFNAAKKALDAVDDQGRKSTDYLTTMVGYASASGNYVQAEKNLVELCQLEPGKPIPRLNLAALRIHRTDPRLAAEARGELEALRTIPEVRTEALRHLTSDAMRRTNYARALSMVRELVSATNAVFNDRLLELDVLRAAQNSQFQPTFAALRSEVTTNVASTFGLARWMLANTPGETLPWLENIQPEIRTNLPVTMIVADCYLLRSDWITLEAWVGKQAWGELDHLRLAFSARALRDQGLSAAAKSSWSKAVKAAEGRLDRLVALERLTAAWNWPNELEEILWLVVNKFPAEKRAISDLSKLLYLTGKTRSLLTLLARESKAEPGNLATKNDLANIALLLDAAEHNPHELAREVYEKQPENPSYAATYAYSLYLKKKNREALQVMEKLKPEALEKPTVAGYYGAILAASGDKAGAKRYLGLAVKAQTLPEERQLFERASF